MKRPAAPAPGLVDYVERRITVADLAALPAGTKTHQWPLGTLPPFAAVLFATLSDAATEGKFSDGVLASTLTLSAGLAGMPTAIMSGTAIDTGGPSLNNPVAMGSPGAMGATQISDKTLVVQLTSAVDLNTFTVATTGRVCVRLWFVKVNP